MALYVEAWTRPGDANFGRVIDEVPTARFDFHDGVNQVGDGSCVIPDSFDRFDEILHLDLASIADSTQALIRLFDDGTHVFDWLPTQMIPKESKADFGVDVRGEGIKSVLRRARVEAYDWDESDDHQPDFPDWIWGGRNVLRNPGFELSGVTPLVYDVWNDATGGTFTLSFDGTGPTDPINYNEGATTVQNRIEQDLANVDDVLVSGSGTETDPWRIEFVNPPVASSTGLSGDDSGLTGGTLTILQIQAGDDETPDAWTRSQRADARSTPALHGCPTIFRRSSGAEPVLFGNYSLVVAGTCQYTGFQQVASVQPGGIYQMSVWVQPNTTNQTFRLVARDRYERILTTASGGQAFVEYTPAEDDWTRMILGDVLMNVHDETQPNNIGEPVAEIVWRVGNINPTPAGIWYFDMDPDDDGLREGLAETSVGGILEALYDDAVSDHSTVRVCWEDDANPATPYLLIDFTETLDSNGDPWDIDDIQFKATMRMTYLQIMERLARDFEVEWRVVATDVEAGEWTWQVYNKGSMQTDRTSDASPAIQGGSADVRRSIQRFMPTGTDLLVEGLERRTSRERSDALADALGRIESSRLDRDLPNQTTVNVAAASDVLNALPGALTYTYTLVAPPDVPLVAYDLGDLITIHDPPEVDATGRLVDVTYTKDTRRDEWTVVFYPPELAGS